MQQDLFRANREKAAPLADRMRPRTLDEFIGQAHIVGEGRLLRRAIELDRLSSSIFFGPPGCGKTALAYVIANSTGAEVYKLNAVTAGVKDVREIIEKAKEQLSLYGRNSFLLLDECHRWNKAQSDSILPALENGTLRFIGSTTENPMISMTGAIVSRCRVFQFYPLKPKDIERCVLNGLNDAQRGLGSLKIKLFDDALNHIIVSANGDCRAALNALELAALTTPEDKDGIIQITLEIAAESMQQKVLALDEQLYYDMLSAFCKSLRGSDSNASLAWFARLIYGGVDPRIIARRLIAHASEDIGMANPNALVQAVAAFNALEYIGLPEARLPLAQAIIYICESPKSNSVLKAVDAAMEDAKTSLEEPVPLHLRDTSYSGAKALGSGQGYKYPHDYPGHYVNAQYMPPSLKGRIYYEPSNQGSEAAIKENRIKRNKG